MLTLRTGLTQRLDRGPAVTDRQTSGLASVRATHWLTDRVQGGARAYYSSGRTSAREVNFGATGGALDLTYWPTDALSLRGTVGLDRLRYDRATGTARDRIGSAGLTARWRPRPSVTVFGRARALSADLAGERGRSDLLLSVGVRLRTQTTLGGTPPAPSPQRRVCRATDAGVRIRVPYDGDGTLYVTGDFNGWSLPGVRLTASGEGAHTATLDLPPGRYAYRLRVVEGGDARWRALPSSAQTTESAFGGPNGVCIVP
jgi:hypothetical protein